MFLVLRNVMCWSCWANVLYWVRFSRELLGQRLFLDHLFGQSPVTSLAGQPTLLRMVGESL